MAASLEPLEFNCVMARRVYEKILELRTRGIDEELYFFPVMTELKGEVFHWANEITDGKYQEFVCTDDVGYYESKLRNYNYREIVDRVISQYSGKTDDASFIKGKIEEEMLRVKRKAPDLATVKGMLERAFRECEAMSESGGGLPGLSTGYTELDRMLLGLRAGDLIVVAARPSMGKSMFCLNLGLNVAKKGKVVRLQALEETLRNLSTRIAANLSGVATTILNSGKATSTHYSSVIEAINDNGGLNLVVDDTHGLSSGKLCEVVRQEALARPIDLLIVDHLQELVEENVQNRHLGLSRAMTNLRGLAKELKIPIVIACQINRAVEARKVQMPFLADLKESGDIEAKADIVMILYREKYYSPEMGADILDVKVAKNRNGETGMTSLLFDAPLMRIEEIK